MIRDLSALPAGHRLLVAAGPRGRSPRSRASCRYGDRRAIAPRRTDRRRRAGGARHRRLHALSRARADPTAGVPAGSASNFFRTRAELVAAALARLEEHDEQDWRAAQVAAPPPTPEAPAGAFAGFVEAATGPLRIRTVAGYVLYTQGAVEPALPTTLNANRGRVVGLAAAALAEHGVPTRPPRPPCCRPPRKD